MATTSVDIANLALYQLGADKIDALADDNERAKACNEFYNQSRQEILVLTRPGWNCAKKRLELDVDNSVPTFDYNNKFRLPDDCLRVLYPSDTNGQPVRVDWERRGKYLLINDSNCFLVYIKDLEDVTEMSPLLIRSISLQIASHISVRLKQSTTLKKNIDADLAVAVGLAEGTEASEKFSQNPGSLRRTGKILWVDEK